MRGPPADPDAPGALARLRRAIEPAGLAPSEALALLILLSGAVALTAVVWSTNRPSAGPPPPDGPAALAELGVTPTPSAAPSPSPAGPVDRSSPPAEAVVHVAGAVVQPGLVTVPAGARVDEAIRAAGGPTDEAVLDGLNLARPVVDGEQVRVPVEGEEVAAPPAPAGPGDDGVGAAGGPLDLNAATADQLAELPGIGPVTAERILAHREAIGGFDDVAQLLEVPGIGPGRFAELEPRVRVVSARP